MTFFTTNNIQEISTALLNKKIGILPTDTIYGIHCLVHDKELIERVYEIKQRPDKMPFIVVISAVKQLDGFDLFIDDFAKEQMQEFWPGPNTLIFDSPIGTQAFRLPNNEFLISIVESTGPLISTSANLHGSPHAQDLQTAQGYFAEGVDFYVDGGVLNNPPSSIYKIVGGVLEKIR